MGVKGSITYVGMDAIKPAELKRAVKKGLQQAVDQWHDDILPKHFERGAKNRYRYKDRKKNYQIRKARVKGHTRELEFSGQLKRQVLRKARISGTSKRATVSMNAPAYMYKYKVDQPDKAAELTAVTQDEVQTMAVQLDKNLAVQLKQNNRKQTVRA